MSLFKKNNLKNQKLIKNYIILSDNIHNLILDKIDDKNYKYEIYDNKICIINEEIEYSKLYTFYYLIIYLMIM